MHYYSPYGEIRTENETNKNRQEANFCVFSLCFQIFTTISNFMLAVVQQQRCYCHYIYLSAQGGYARFELLLVTALLFLLQFHSERDA